MRYLDNEVDIAELTHRLITSQQLRRLGYTPRQIRYRLSSELYHEILDGVLSLDPGPHDFLTRTIALSLRYPKGYLSGAAAPRYWGLRKGMSEHYEYTLPSNQRPKDGRFALFRYTSNIHEDDVRNELHGLRVSSPARTLFDSASRLDEFGLRSMMHDALERRLVTTDELSQVGDRLCVPGRRGTRLWRQVVKATAGVTPVQSEAELILIDALRRAGLAVVPQHPLRLANGGTIHLDAGIPGSMLDVEVDGPPHNDPIAIHRDKSRDFHVAVQGWQTMRIPTDDIQRRLRVVVAGILVVARQRLILAS